MISMFALVTDDGTAMSETALCEDCVKNEQCVAYVLQCAQPDWNKRMPFLDSTGNEILQCQCCEYDPYNLSGLVDD